MINSLFKLAFILVVGVLVYNYFLGDEAEKQTAKEVFGKVKDVGVAVKDLLQSEKEKFDSGKYNEALDKIGGLFDNLKKEAKEVDETYVDRIAQLDDKRKELEQRLKELQSANKSPTQYEEFTSKGVSPEQEERLLRRELETLMKETEKMVEQMEQERRD